MVGFLLKLRALRILLGILMFFAISVQFFDMYHKLPKPYWMYNPTGTQLLPSLLEMLGGAGIAAGAAFISFSVCALIFGRVYCSCFCPFGILMDILRRVSIGISKFVFFKNNGVGKFLSRTKKMRFAKARNLMRAAFLLLAFMFIGLGATALLGFIDPYSLFGKIMGAFVHPTLAAALNGISSTLSSADVYWISAVDGNAYVSLTAFSIAFVILFLIWLASAFGARLYCNTVCPVGAWLGLLSKFSLFKIKLDTSACVKCGLCERNCKAQCIDSKNGTVDFSRCILCFDCALNCKKNAIVFEPDSAVLNFFKLRKKNAGNVASGKSGASDNSRKISAIAEKPAASDGVPSHSRRNFAGVLGALGASLLMGAKKGKCGGNAGACKNFPVDADASPFGLHGARADKRLGVPAGAESLENYLQKCTGCQICTSACKANILKPSLGEWGLSGLMQPYMDFTNGYCLYTCHSCTKACPTGAIKFLSGKQKRSVKIGTAKFKRSLCVVKTDGTDCAACAEHCPVQAIEMIPFGNRRNALYIPHVHEDVCIGCGACEYICPVRPERAIVVQGLSVHRKAKEWNDSMRIYKLPQNAASPKAADANANPFPF